MTHRARSIVLALAATLVVAACGSGTAATAPPSLEGRTWRVVEIAGQATLGNDLPTMTFAGGRVRGDTGCNTFTADVTVGPGTIDLGGINSTLRLCDGQIGETETTFMRALVGASALSFDAEGDLHLTGGGGEIRLHAVPGG